MAVVLTVRAEVEDWFVQRGGGNRDEIHVGAPGLRALSVILVLQVTATFAWVCFPAIATFMSGALPHPAPGVLIRGIS